jgi:hypothetical protein
MPPGVAGFWETMEQNNWCAFTSEKKMLADTVRLDRMAGHGSRHFSLQIGWALPEQRTDGGTDDLITIPNLAMVCVQIDVRLAQVCAQTEKPRQIHSMKRP